MRIQGFYDAAQDRILLQLQEVSPSENVAFWLTRRQLLTIVMACYRVRAATRQSNAQVGSATKAPAKTPAAVPKAAGAVKGALVSSLKFRRIPSGGLRIHIETAAQEPFVLALNDGGLSSFIGLVEDLAGKAKWDLSAALLRMGLGRSAAPQKHMWH